VVAPNRSIQQSAVSTQPVRPPKNPGRQYYLNVKNLPPNVPNPAVLKGAIERASQTSIFCN
jgi:hypothetical protein